MVELVAFLQYNTVKYNSVMIYESSLSDKPSDCSVGDEESVFYGAESLICLSKNTSFNQRAVEKKVTDENRCCQLCLVRKTPLWRRTEQYHTLCNACGIRERVHGQRYKNGVCSVPPSI